jgi:uncharacterized protein (DUF1697 family)
MTQRIALLRGINVGRAKRIAMAELRRQLEALGLRDVRTLLNSGNAVFEVARPNPAHIAAAIEASIRAHSGFSATVAVVTAAQLDAIVAANPLAQAGRDPAKFLVGFVHTPAALRPAKALLAQSWAPEAFALGEQAAYLWCAGGIADSKLVQAFTRCSGESATARNWATVGKLQAMARAGAGDA